MASTRASAAKNASSKASRVSISTASKATAPASTAASRDTTRGTALSRRDRDRARVESPPRTSTKLEPMSSDESEGESFFSYRVRSSRHQDAEDEKAYLRSRVHVYRVQKARARKARSHRPPPPPPQIQRKDMDQGCLSKTMKIKSPILNSMNDSVLSMSNTSSKSTTGPSHQSTSSSQLTATPMVP